MKKEKAERQDYSYPSLIKSKMEKSIENGKRTSQLCIDELKKRGCDFSILFWLRNQESLPGTEIGSELLIFLQDLSLPIELFAHSDFRDGYFSHLRAEFNVNGLKKVAPENFVETSGEGGKALSIQLAARANWPRPNQTFCFQTRGKNSAFFVFQCWQDGVRKILELFKTPWYNSPTGARVKVEQIYEHAWGDTRLSRLLIDWEIESPWASNRRTPEQLRATAEKFPVWFVQKLVSHNALDQNARVHCTVKDKTREIERGTKVSFHFAFNITGCLKGSHKTACMRVLTPIMAQLKSIADKKSLDKLSDKEIDEPYIGIDWRTVSGSHGFSVPFSRKKPEDPYPSVPHKLVIYRDEREDKWRADRHDFSWKETEHSFAALGESKCLQIFYHASFTPPAGDSVSYLRLCSAPAQDQVRVFFLLPRGIEPRPSSAELTEAHQGQRGVVTRHKAVHHPGAPDFLPAWLVSDLNSRGGGGQLHTKMPCLQEGSYLYNSLHDKLNRGREAQDVKVLKMARLSNFPCPVNLDKTPPRIHIHPSNGVFIAVDDQTIYCSCSECKFEEDRGVKGGSLTLVKGTEGGKYGWATITEESYKTLLSSASVTGTGKRKHESTSPMKRHARTADSSPEPV